MHGSYTMLTNPIRALELHYPIIQFLIIVDGLEAFSLLLSIKSAMFSDFGQSSGEKKRKTINFSHQIVCIKLEGKWEPEIATIWKKVDAL